MSNIHNENLKENKMNDVIEELEKKFTIKDLNTILNHITFWLYKNINDKYTDEFVQVDNVALLRSIKELKNNICVDTTGRALVLGLDKSDIVEIFADKFTKISAKNKDDGKPLFDKQKFLDRIGVNNEST